MNKDNKKLIKRYQLIKEAFEATDNSSNIKKAYQDYIDLGDEESWLLEILTSGKYSLDDQLEIISIVMGDVEEALEDAVE